MALDVSRVDVWAGQMADKPGTLARKLAKLAKAGANLEFVLARRRPERRGRGVVFVAPIQGAKLAAAARKAGFRKSPRLVALRVSGTDKAGTGAAMAGALGDAGINIRGLSASVIGRKFVTYLALDSAADATLAGRALRKL